MRVPSKSSYVTKLNKLSLTTTFAFTAVYGVVFLALHMQYMQSFDCSSSREVKSPQTTTDYGRKQVKRHNNVSHTDENRFTKPPLFNPWRDFVFTPLSSGMDHSFYYSSHTCVAAASTDRRQDFVSRTCHYRNLYYHIATKTWHYFPNPSEQSVLRRESGRLDEMDVNIWHVREAFEDRLVKRISVPYRPQVHLTDDIPGFNPSKNRTMSMANIGMPNESRGSVISSSKVQVLSMNNGMRPVFVLYKGSMANFGHFIWDDYLSIYSQLDLLDLSDDDNFMPIPFIQDERLGGSFCCADNSHNYPQCTSFMKRLYPALWNMDTDCSGDVVRTNNWLQGPSAIGAWNRHPHEPCDDYRDNITNFVDAEYVLVPNVTVGSGRLALFSCYGDCTLGRGPQLFRFRNFLMRRMLGHSHATNPKGYITFSLAIGATRGKGEVTMFAEEIASAKAQYGDDGVKAVDLANMTLQEQALLIANSAVLFINHGGGSASTVFLPKGASAFLYWSDQQRDNEFYRSVGYFRTEWISYNARRDVARTMRLLEMQLVKTAILYPKMICFVKGKVR